MNNYYESTSVNLPKFGSTTRTNVPNYINNSLSTQYALIDIIKNQKINIYKAFEAKEQKNDNMIDEGN